MLILIEKNFENKFNLNYGNPKSCESVKQVREKIRFRFSQNNGVVA